MPDSFNPLDWPIIFTRPDHVTTVSAWKEHLPFAFFLIDALRPATFVELGTHAGDSYFGFCQAIAKTGSMTKAFAVDTWQGDDHSGAYSDDVYTDLRRAHDPLFGGFSTLLRMRFNEALTQFEDGQVDLLHIDGLHTYAAVKDDFETWLPKVRDGGVILFHDVAVKMPGFEVFRLMDELRGRHTLFEFMHGNGLGVLIKGQTPEPLRPFMAAAAERPGEVRGVFENIGRRWALERYLAASEGGEFGLPQRAKRYLRRLSYRVMPRSK